MQRISPNNEKYFVSVQNIVTYGIVDTINLATLFPQDLLQAPSNCQLYTLWIVSQYTKLPMGLCFRIQSCSQEDRK